MSKFKVGDVLGDINNPDEIVKIIAIHDHYYNIEYLTGENAGETGGSWGRLGCETYAYLHQPYINEQKLKKVLGL